MLVGEGEAMPLLRSAIATGLLVIGLHVLVGAAATEAVAQIECPCIQTANACVRDDACEAHKFQRQRWRQQYQRPAVSVDPAPPRAKLGSDSRSRGPSPASADSGAQLRSAPTSSNQGYAAPRRAPAPPPVAAPRPTAAPNPAAAPRPTAAPNPTAAPRPTAAPVPGSPRPASTASARPRILETGYSHLAELGREVDGYGLYSYAILPSDSNRAALFLSEAFKEIPSIGDTSARPAQLNIFYIPLRKDKEADFAALLRTPGHDAAKLGAEYTKSFYDYRMARALLDHVCNPPDPSVLELCNGDLSRGPYIFTYASPASKIEPVPPPFLFVDLSDVHERAFGELLAAFQAQVKREDIADQAKIRTMRLNILQVVLTAADWISPVQKAIADIVHTASGDDKK
jgi:hypothetical protein